MSTRYFSPPLEPPPCSNPSPSVTWIIAVASWLVSLSLPSTESCQYPSQRDPIELEPDHVTPLLKPGQWFLTSFRVKARAFMVTNKALLTRPLVSPSPHLLPLLAWLLSSFLIVLHVVPWIWLTHFCRRACNRKQTHVSGSKAKELLKGCRQKSFTESRETQIKPRENGSQESSGSLRRRISWAFLSSQPPSQSQWIPRTNLIGHWPPHELASLGSGVLTPVQSASTVRVGTQNRDGSRGPPSWVNGQLSENVALSEGGTLKGSEPTVPFAVTSITSTPLRKRPC